MAALAPSGARIRAYNVGFGDCFLLTFDYPDGQQRHMLIDFGSTGMPKTRGPKDLMQVAGQIAEDCGGKLHMVVATHRHADHISGFAGDSGRVIAELDPDLVVQPWTEQPDLAPDATGRGTAGSAGDGNGPRGFGPKSLVARLADVHLTAELLTRDIPALAAAKTVPKTVVEQLTFLGNENLFNREAVEALSTLGRRRVYARFGTKLPVKRLLPGVRMDVLGPPTLRQSKAIAKQARVNEEFWHLTASSDAARRSGAPEPIFPKAKTVTPLPQETRWLIPQVDKMNAEEALSLVRILDDVMNNTSLILLLEVGDTRLLFPGDAQLENWSYALRDAPNAAEIRRRLASTRLYKVGHHGSLNATPKKMLWEAFERTREEAPDDKLITLVSTMAGKHGSESRGTEVPRKPLVAELRRKSVYVTTQEGTTASQFWRDVTLPLG